MSSSEDKARFALAVGWITLFIIGTDLFVVSPLLPLIARTYGVSPSTAGWTVGVFSIAYAVGSPLFGALADRWGKRTTIVAGLVCFAGANALTGFAPNFAWLLVGRVLAGVSAAAVTPSVYAISGETASPERRGSAIAFVGSGLLIALATGAPSGSAIADVSGWRAVFFLLAGAIAALALANRLVWPSLGPAGGFDEGADTRPRAALGAVFGGTLPLTVLGAVFATVVWGTAVYGLYTYLGTWLRGGDGPSAVPAAAALVVYGVGAALGSNVGGRLSDRFGARRVATSSLVGLAIPLAVIGLLLPGGAALIGALGIYGLVAYAFFPAHQTRLAKEFPERSATFLAWNNSALYAGITFGSVLGGVVMSSAGFGALAYACAAVALVGSALSARRTLPGRARARDETNAAQRS